VCNVKSRMRNIFILSIVILFSISDLSGQVIDRYNVDPSCSPGLCDVCLGDDLLFSLRGQNIDFGTDVSIMVGNNAAFDPYNSGTFLFSFPLRTTPPRANPGTTCPSQNFLQIDACPDPSQVGIPESEEDNEFMIINAGSGFDFTTLEIDVDQNNGPGENEDIGPSCPLVPARQEFLDEIKAACPCTKVSNADPANPIILPGTRVVIALSRGYIAGSYRFQNICTGADRIVVMQNACDRSIGAFDDNVPSPRISRVAVNIPSLICSNVRFYSMPSVDDGNFVEIIGTTAIATIGQPCPIVVPTQPPIASNPTISDMGPRPASFQINPDWCDQTIFLKPALLVDPPFPRNCLITAPAASVRINCPRPQAASNSPICPGRTLELFGTRTPTPGTSTFSWRGPNGFTSTLQNPTIRNASAAASGVYTLTENLNGCTATTTVAVVVAGATFPPVNLTYNSQVCEGSPLRLTATPLIPGATFTFRGPGGFEVITASNTITVSPSATQAMVGVYTVTARIVDCVSDPATVNVDVVPRAEGGFVGSSVTICQGETAAIPIQFIGGRPNFTSLMVTVPSIPFQSVNVNAAGNTTSVNVSPTVTTVYRLTNLRQANNTCDVTLIGTDFTVNVIPIIPLLVTVTPPNPCEGDDVTFRVAPGGRDYLWSGPQGFASIAQDASLRGVVPAQSGIYRVTVTTNDGCRLTGQVNLTVAPIGNITLTPASVCEGSGVVPLRTLMGLTPPTAGGVWTGNGTRAGNFDPALVTGGARVITVGFSPSGCFRPAVSTITINPILEAPLTGGTSICQGAPNFNLTTLLPAGAPAGTFSGTGVNVTSFSSLGAPGDYTITYTPTGPCARPTTTTIRITPGERPILRDTVICEGQSVNLSDLLDPRYPSGSWSGNGVSGSIFSSSTLSGTIRVLFTPTGNCILPVEANIRIKPLPTATLTTPNQVVCQGQSLGLNVNFTGIGPFDLVYQTGTVNSNPVGLPGPSYTIPVNANIASTVRLISVSADGCDGTVDGFTNISVSEPMSTSNLTTFCNGQEFVVSFTILGGVAPYTVTGVTGSFVGNVFTSNLIPSQTNLSISISDSGPCPDLDFTATRNCSCTSDAGVLGAGVNGCQGSNVSCASGSNPGTDPDDVVRYVLSTTAIPTAGSILAIGNAPNFPWVNTYSTGTTYYIVRLVYSSLPDPNTINFGDPCFSRSNGVPVIFNASPDLQISRDTLICEGTTSILNLNMQGSPRFDITYQDPSGVQSVSFNSTSGSISLNPSTTSSYRFTLIEDANGCQRILNLNYQITVETTSQITISGNSTICEKDSATLTITTNASLPLSFVLTENGVNSQNVSITRSPSTIRVGPSNNTTYGINNLVHSGRCRVDIQGSPQITVRNLPSGSISGGGVLCGNGGLDLPISLLPNIGSYNIQLIGTPRNSTFPNVPGGNSNIRFNATGNSRIDSLIISDASGCVSRVPITPAIDIQVRDKAVGNNITTTCINGDTEYQVRFTISGGSAANYSVQGAGSLAGNSFVSDPIPSGDTYRFIIRDGGPCPPDTISGSFNCNCRVDAGRMPTTQARVCLPGTSISSLFLGGEILTPGDVLVFILSTGNNATGTILGFSTNTSFGFLPSMVKGQTYYITAAAGKPNPGGGILNTGCFDFSNSTPVVFWDRPSVTISGPNTYCPNEIANITLNFTGSQPFDYSLQSPGGNQNVNGFSANTTNLNFPVTSGGVIQLTSLTDITGCPADLSSRLTIQLKQPAQSNLNQTLCNNGSIRIGNVTFNSANPVGAVIFRNGAFNGCDSTVNVQLSFRNRVERNFNPVLCQGRNILVNGIRFDANNLQGDVLFPGAAAGGCDSLVKVSVSFYPQASFNLNRSLCAGQTLLVGSTLFSNGNPTGQVVLPNASFRGCDSTINVALTFTNSVVNNINRSLCSGSFITVNGVRYDQNRPSGTERITGGSSGGCDSIINVSLTFVNEVTNNITRSLCNGASIVVNGIRFDQGNPRGTQRIAGGSQAGCDSVINVNLTFVNEVVNNLSRTLCTGEFILVNNTRYDVSNPSGTQRIVGGSQAGCDSVINVSLSFTSPVNLRLNANSAACIGDSLVIRFIYSSLGTYQWSWSDGFGNVRNESGTGIIFERKMAISGTLVDSIRVTNWRGNTCQSVFVPAIRPRIGQVTSNIIKEIKQGGFNVSCNGGSNGRIQVVGISSSTPVLIQWENSSADLIRTNLAAGIYNATLTDGAGCKQTIREIITEPNPIAWNLLSTEPGCKEGGKGAIKLNNISGGVGPYTLTWNNQQVDFSSGTWEKIDIENGDQSLELTDANGCSRDTSFVLKIVLAPEVTLTSDQTILFGDSTRIIATPNFQPTKIVWTPSISLSCASCLNPFAKPIKDTRYFIEVSNALGCKAKATVNIYLKKESPVFIPNIFSPNGDNENDVFYIYPGPSAEKIKSFKIFGRWGEMVHLVGEHEFTDAFGGWDGRHRGVPYEIGVYMYVAEILMKDGTTEVMKGDVVLSR
jgi:gliding motility-associated-like protein